MKSQHIRIKNFGPIKSIDMDLKRFSFFIGLQGSGKSTVAKVVSYCMWVEKEFSTTFSNELFATKEQFMNRLLEFHKLNGYNKPNTEIYYDTDFIHIEYSESNYNIEIKNKFKYQKSKILYVPSERNLTIMPDFEKVNLGNNSMRSFLFDWFEARKKYSRTQTLEVFDLGIRYFSEEDGGLRQNRLIHQNGNSFEISLSDASSGMQSVIPLEVVIDYFTSTYYNEKENADTSFFYKEKQQKIYASLLKEFVLENENVDIEKSLLKISTWLKNIANHDVQDNDPFIEAFDNLIFPHLTHFIIEEPEQNLYPTTQKAFLAFLIACCNKEERKHSYLITTHSPFLLNYLTLFVKASQIVKNCCKQQKKDLSKFVSLDSIVDVDEFDIFEFKNGFAKKLSKQYDLPSDENLLNKLLEETNQMFGDLLELEDLCQK